LNRLLNPPQHRILERLLRDVFSLLSIDRQSLAQVEDEHSLLSLSQYFESDEFIELAMESLNLFLFSALDSSPHLPPQAPTAPRSSSRSRDVGRLNNDSHIPTHHTALELCLQHSVDLLASQEEKEKHRSALKVSGSLRGRKRRNYSVDYNLHPVVLWSERESLKKKVITTSSARGGGGGESRWLTQPRSGPAR
jgi:hypothetical protein